jgi:hypothetical protein
MRRLLLAALVGSLLIGFTGCLDDDDDNLVYYLELGVVDGDNEGDFLIVTDSDTKLKLLNYPDDFEIEDGKRVLIKYVIEDSSSAGGDYDFLVNAYSLENVIVKNIIELNEENRDTIGTDPLVINSIWIEGGFLNVDFTFMGADKIHYINMVKDPEEQEGNETRIYLQVRHKNNGDLPYQRFRGIMSFLLEPLQVEGSSMVTLVFNPQNYYSIGFNDLEVEYEY